MATYKVVGYEQLDLFQYKAGKKEYTSSQK